MTFIRTFHPIGQGAFYTERYTFGQTKFTMVYDCGSMALARLKEIMESVFPEDDNSIDVLFISHFHEDHINGLPWLKEHCKIRRVVIPLFDDNEKEEAIFLYKISSQIANNFSGDNDVFDKLIDSPESFFDNDTTIIGIKSTIVERSLEDSHIIDISAIRERSVSYASGTPLRAPLYNKQSDWVFVPFNYKQNERKQQFYKELGTQFNCSPAIDELKKTH